MLKRKLSVYVQLVLWVCGKSVHNKITGECCPDFSCCNKELQEPFKNRLHYALKYPFNSLIYSYRVHKENKLYFKGNN